MDKKDITSETDIKNLIDKFYTKVIADPVIGFIFTDVINLSWEKHIPVMIAFWSSVLLGTNGYTGNPLTKHIELDKKIPLTKIHFERWIELWENTIAENYKGKIADEAILKAKNIASVLQIKIGKNKTPENQNYMK